MQRQREQRDEQRVSRKKLNDHKLVARVLIGDLTVVGLVSKFKLLKKIKYQGWQLKIPKFSLLLLKVIFASLIQATTLMPYLLDLGICFMKLTDTPADHQD